MKKGGGEAERNPLGAWGAAVTPQGDASSQLPPSSGAGSRKRPPKDSNLLSTHVPHGGRGGEGKKSQALSVSGL